MREGREINDKARDKRKKIQGKVVSTESAPVGVTTKENSKKINTKTLICKLHRNVLT